MNNTPIENFSQTLNHDGISDAIELLRQHFESDGDYHRMFEVLKVRCRYRLGLPLLPTSTAESGDRLEQLETCLLSACKEVGTLLFQSGRPELGWPYLQPVGDSELAKKLLMEVEVTDDNRDLIVDLGMGQNIAPVYAFEIVLKSFGVCDAITAIDVRNSQGGFASGDLEAIAETLLRSFYDEVEVSVRDDIGQRDKNLDTTLSLGQMLDRYEFLVVETGHHMDATHLNSIVKIARNVGTKEHYQLALDLCRYGQRLPDDFKYVGDAPFESTYDDHVHFFAALLGENVDAAIAHFKEKIRTCAPHDQTVTVEHVVALLVRIDRRAEALELHLLHLNAKETWGIAPTAIEIASTPELRQRLMQHFEQTGDLLGFAMCKLQQQQT